MHSSLTIPHLTVLVAGTTIALFHIYFSNRDNAQARFWKAHPMSDARSEWFWWARVVMRSVFGSKSMVDDGYNTYSSRNNIFGAPSIDRGAFVVIPPQQLKSIYDLPESVVDAHWTQSENIQAKYTIGDPEVFSQSFHVNVIRNQITRSLDYLTAGITEEITLGFEKHWGVDDKEWRRVAAWPSCLQIVAEAVNRVFIGAPHCRNKEFLEATKWHAEWVFSNAFLIHAVPWIFKPVLGNLIWLYGRRVRSKCLKPMLPLIKERLSRFLQQANDPSADWDPPQDGLQWLIEEAWKTGNAKYIDPSRIGHRLLILNFVSMHTTSFTLANALQDLFSEVPSIGSVEDLREECARVLKEAGGVWTKDAVSKLHLVDSTIRESMRISSFSILALPRRVVAEEGITIDDDVHIPKGIYLATPMDAIHLDAKFYSDPTKFHPFRFCHSSHVQGTRTQELYKNRDGDATMPPLDLDKTSAKAKSTVTLDDKFLSFGFGRNACPGRFFALHEIKLMMAHILLNYDIQYFKKRPEQFKIMWVQLPHEKTHFTIKRRLGTI
ncbi:cytochrome P450 [Cucurbitaria berberidis CBS 394.84]|uniref:Cytochrome P450 n=1 Tax=Cucurbitaria berberidis CBS 394.84 TaxID=1168544 RepID=A0A9P4LFM5_9PLEO|nr:cytochrome P450 [Cucurbitaria berberidis CBS 394.84]KAF1852229.1 cytochrome P450 [Cucurbitaria berberidis CBS 394.84]